MKKIMIIGAGVYQVPLISKAKEKGLYTIAVSPDGPYPGLDLADKVYYYDVRDQEKILEAAKAEKIDGVTTDQTDIAVRTVAYVAEQMGLAGIGYETAKLFTDKYLMRQKCQQLGLPTIRHARVTGIEEAERFYQQLHRDAIIKPVDSQGSRGVFRIDSIQKLREKFEETKRLSGSGRVIIEEFIRGTEFEADSIVLGGKAKTLMYADLVPYDIPDIFASTTRLYPSTAPADVVDKLLLRNQQVIEGFGLRQGLTHSEYIRDEQGEIYLIEAAARGGGTYISSHIAKLQTGVDTSEYLIGIALGEIRGIPDFTTGQCACGYVTFYLPEGTVVSVEGVEDVKNAPWVYQHSLDEIHIGLKTEAFSDKTARYAVIPRADSREELLERIDEVMKMLKIKVETERGIEGPVWS